MEGLSALWAHLHPHSSLFCGASEGVHFSQLHKECHTRIKRPQDVLIEEEELGSSLALRVEGQ
ncbi:MAG TPA: hypothetical protein VGW33_11635 [Terriglobia bacterium]|nr:hypothetical protein [Terriglobia bacterium]